MAKNAPQHLPELTGQRSGIVVLPVAVTDVLHLAGQRPVAVRRYCGKEMVLNLVAKIAGQNMKPLATAQIRGTPQLAQIPVSTAFAIQHRTMEDLGIGREVPTENDGKGPQIANQIGHQITAQHGEKNGPPTGERADNP